LQEEWGRFLYIKINGPEIFKRQRIKKGAKILISTATDPYQPPESRYCLTRAILKELVNRRVSVSILTKSALVTRDIDIIKDIEDVEVGFSITVIDESLRSKIEPGASRIKETLIALEKLKKAGIRTWCFIAPILPGITERSLPRLFPMLKELGITRVVVDRLNYAKRLKLFVRFGRSYFEKIK
jgi:DNA repair photolyase